MMLKHSEYKGRFKDSVGRYRTQSLFREMNSGKGEFDPLYTLKDEDPKGKLPSLKQMYLEANDPTEYEFAIAAFGEWHHWDILSKLAWMEEYVYQWREELEIKMRSDAVKIIIKEAQTGKGKYNAAKFLSDAGWKSKTRGRPTEAERKRQAKIQAGIDVSIAEDLERIA
jgi:hypothetical protein